MTIRRQRALPDHNDVLSDKLKNVQVIDGAQNCLYDIFAFTDQEFNVIFPAPRQDIEFYEDVIARIGEKAAGDALRNVWNRPVKKHKVKGIHGTLFYELENKKKYYPTKIDEEATNPKPQGFGK